MTDHTPGKLRPWPVLTGTSRDDLCGAGRPCTLALGRGGSQIILSTEDYAHARACVNCHDDLVALLADLEWASHGLYGKTCPSCYGSERENWGYTTAGHKPDCRLVQALKRARGENPHTL